MRFEWLRIGFLVLMMALVLCGCVQIDIGDDLAMPTLGEQFIDLQRAYFEGAISAAEFAAVKRELLASAPG